VGAICYCTFAYEADLPFGDYTVTAQGVPGRFKSIFRPWSFILRLRPDRFQSGGGNKSISYGRMRVHHTHL
jgi:hypothetical protein